MSYKGLETTSQDDYIFSDIIPHNPDFDLEELKIIQTKLEDFTSGKSFNGLTSYEAEVFLDWITFNARNYAVKDCPESPLTASMASQCAPTQRINVTLLRKFGLDAKPFNMGNCIGEIPLSEAVTHSVSLVDIPIMDNLGYTQSYKFVLDPTFRQFCQKENCNSEKFFDQGWLSRGYSAPHPGYFMDASNLLQLGVSTETAEQTEALGKYLIHKGYFCLNEETAKLYGDTFVRASKRYEFQRQPIYMSGNDYLENFQNIPMRMLGSSSKDKDNDFLKLPSELSKEKQTFFSKIKNFFVGKFGKKQPKMLSSGNPEIPTSSRKLEWVQLTPEAYKKYKEGTKEILRSYNENDQLYNTPPSLPDNNERFQ